MIIAKHDLLVCAWPVQSWLSKPVLEGLPTTSWVRRAALPSGHRLILRALCASASKEVPRCEASLDLHTIACGPSHVKLTLKDSGKHENGQAG